MTRISRRDHGQIRNPLLVLSQPPSKLDAAVAVVAAADLVLLRSSAQSSGFEGRKKQGSCCWFCWRIKTREPYRLPSVAPPPCASLGELEVPPACPCVGPGRAAAVLRHDAWKARLRRCRPALPVRPPSMKEQGSRNEM
jgi:hypothetical protein